MPPEYPELSARMIGHEIVIFAVSHSMVLKPDLKILDARMNSDELVVVEEEEGDFEHVEPGAGAHHQCQPVLLGCLSGCSCDCLSFLISLVELQLELNGELSRGRPKLQK